MMVATMVHDFYCMIDDGCGSYCTINEVVMMAHGFYCRISDGCHDGPCFCMIDDGCHDDL